MFPSEVVTVSGDHNKKLVKLLLVTKHWSESIEMLKKIINKSCFKC